MVKMNVISTNDIMKLLLIDIQEIMYICSDVKYQKIKYYKKIYVSSILLN